MRAILLALGKIESLKLLDISYNKISDPSLNVGAVISANLHLEQLNLSYCQFKPEHMIELFKENKLNMKSLNISGNQIPEAAIVYLTAMLSNATCLQYLSFSNCNLQATVMYEISRNVKHSIKHLDLSYNTIPTIAAELLAAVIRKSVDLEFLNLSNCKVEKEELYLIFKALKKALNLRFLDLTSIPLDITLAGGLAEIVSNNTHSLDHLSLSNCSLMIEGFLKVADAFEMTTVLKHLNVSSNHITSRVMDKLATAAELLCKNSHLNHLDISECQWDKSSLSKMFLTMKKLHGLRYINCSGCKMDYVDYEWDYADYIYLSNFITINDTLEQLILANCGLSATGLVIILNALKILEKLHHLDVSSNKMTDEVTAILGEVISCNCIEHLNLSHCSLGANCTVVLTAIANSGTLQYFDLSDNDISDDEASCVASAITANEYLHHINLTNNKFSTNSIKLILNAMASINLIRNIYLSSYRITDELAVDVEAVALSNKGLVSVALDEYNIAGLLSASILKLVVKNKLSIMNHAIHYIEGYHLESLISPELQHLKLAGCELTETFLMELAHALSKNNKLQHLNLSYASLTPRAAAKVCDVLSNFTTFNSLKMTGCKLNRTIFLSGIRTLIILDLSNNPISNQHVDDVANLVANNCNLQHLNLSNCSFTSSGVLTITEALSHLKGLVYLNLQSNHLSDQLNLIAENFAALITSNKDMESLYLPNCNIHDMGILFEEIEKCFAPKYKHTLHWDTGNDEISYMFIHNTRIALASRLECKYFISIEVIASQNQLNQLCDILPEYKAQNITIECCISEEYVCKLFDILYNNPFVLHLDINDSLLSDNNIGIYKFLQQTGHPKQLKLNGVILTKYGINHISSVIAANKNNEQTLYHHANPRLSKCGIKEFYKIFKDSRSLLHFVINSGQFGGSASLDYINVSYSMLPNKDILLVSKILNHLTTLVHINLSHNNIFTEAAELVASGIQKNSFLQHLELASCSLQEQSVRLICDAIAHKTLITLNLSYNCIRDDVNFKLADVISTLNCIECLLLKNCSLYKGINKIIAVLANKNTLKTLDLSCNKMITLDLTAVVMANTHLENLILSDCKLRSIIINWKLPNLKLINLKGNYFDEFTPHLCAIRECAYLHTLILSNCCESQIPANFDSLLMIKHSLKHLDLSYNTISTETAESVADLIHNNTHLEHLNLSNCKLYGEGLNVILEAARKVSSLKYLNLSANTVDYEMASKVADLILNNLSLNYLSLSNCAIQETGFLKIAESLTSTNLINLEISCNIMTSNITAKLATIKAFGEDSQLEYLSISNCVWYEYSLQMLLRSIEHVNNLRSINVGGCKMNDTDAQLLAASITANDTLEQLVLAKCVLQSAGLISVLDALKKLCTLTHLDLSYIKIDKEIMPLLAEVISVNLIEYLNLSHCSLGANCTVVLTAIANSVTLQYLFLSYNDISDDEASCVVSAITANDYLSHLNLPRNQFGQKSLKMILQAMARIVSLQHVNLSSFVIFGELIGELVEVAKSNPGLESMVVLKENLQLSILSKVCM